MLKKILLALSIIGFAIGFSDFGEAPQWGLGRPLGAVFFILFMIVMLLEKEMSLYDQEESRKPTPPSVAPRPQAGNAKSLVHQAQ